MRKGLRPGPYHIGAETISDLPVLVYPENEEHDSVVVGRFPFTKKYDAYAQAVAYCALPDLIDVVRMFMRLHSRHAPPDHMLDDGRIDEVLAAIAGDQSRTQYEREEAEAVLRGRAALRKAESDE